MKLIEKPIEVWVGNLGAYAEGKLVGEWIGLPMQENYLKETLHRIAGDSGELMIMDQSVSGNCSYMNDMIGEWSSVLDLNVIAHQIGATAHPAIQAYLESSGNVFLPELANLFMQEDEIAYQKYEFEGSDDPELMSRLSHEEKLGYTILENDSTLKETLEQLQIGDVSVMSYIDVESIGRDMSFNGYYLTDDGFYPTSAEGPNLSRYSMEEIKSEMGLLQEDVQQQNDIEVKTQSELKKEPTEKEVHPIQHLPAL